MTLPRFAPGPKSCHFQDLLAPDAFAYIGTVEVSGSRNGVFGSP